MCSADVRPSRAGPQHFVVPASTRQLAIAQRLAGSVDQPGLILRNQTTNSQYSGYGLSVWSVLLNDRTYRTVLRYLSFLDMQVPSWTPSGQPWTAPAGSGLLVRSGDPSQQPQPCLGWRNVWAGPIKTAQAPTTLQRQSTRIQSALKSTFRSIEEAKWTYQTFHILSKEGKERGKGKGTWQDHVIGSLTRQIHKSRQASR